MTLLEKIHAFIIFLSLNVSSEAAEIIVSFTAVSLAPAYTVVTKMSNEKGRIQSRGVTGPTIYWISLLLQIWL